MADLDSAAARVRVAPEHEVLIVGAGPTGLMLAGELALAGVDVAIVERRTAQDLMGSRAGGLHARTLEILDQRGIADRFLEQGKAMQVAAFAGVSLDISDFPTRRNYGLALWQRHIERILAEWVDELSIPVYRGLDVTGFHQNPAGVTVALSGGLSIHARYLVGCDGGRSRVRKAAGIAFPGWDATVSHLIAEVELAEEPEWGVRNGATGLHGLSRLDDGDLVRVLVTEPQVGRTDQPTLPDLSAALVAEYGTDYGLRKAVWLSRFTDAARQAESYREGRVLLAGDAAHVHYPAGGQGLNLGVQDAVNLGWKLAQVVKGISPESLLDTYGAERRPVAARALQHTLANVALRRPDDRSKAAREVIADLLQLEEPRKRYAAMMSGLDIRYELGAGHPLLGRRMPDLDVMTAEGPQRVSTLLHGAKPLMLDFGETGGFDAGPWADRVQFVAARHDGAWELPVIGPVTAPAAVLIRPDGYVAWAGDASEPGLVAALTAWFGPPAAA